MLATGCTDEWQTGEVGVKPKVYKEHGFWIVFKVRGLYPGSQCYTPFLAWSEALRFALRLW